MRISICIETQQGASYDQILQIAQASERAGFDGVYLSDHYLRMPDKVGPSGGLPGPTDAWTTLAGLARDTRSIKLGTLLTCATFRLPVPLAIAVAQVDVMSGGRVAFGLGAGWVELEHRVLGIPFPPVTARFDRLEEQLAIITGLWATPPGETFSFSGHHYRVEDSPALPKPAQASPPVIVGGRGRRRTPRLAARFASEYNTPFLSVAEATELFGLARQACQEYERDPQGLHMSAGAIVCCGSDHAEVLRRAAACGVDPADSEHGIMAGTPAQVASQLSEWADAGADHVYLEIDDLDDLEHLELIGREVLPGLR